MEENATLLAHWLGRGMFSLRTGCDEGNFQGVPKGGLSYRHYAGYDLGHAGNPERFTSRRTVICVTLGLNPVL